MIINIDLLILKKYEFNKKNFCNSGFNYYGINDS